MHLQQIAIYDSHLLNPKKLPPFQRFPDEAVAGNAMVSPVDGTHVLSVVTYHEVFLA